ncbi:ionotropic receptor 75a isoform X3 [Culex quinquefasciatus]|uniref:ionotropic receptor 75a isoform X3 n=1 Tax=Culex quinquefasciatus TaxID=7176 RepID=UPI0018E39A35|nr:ionotropic receptor 75a isoform X3 [Culex quinquefasciatus]
MIFIQSTILVSLFALCSALSIDFVRAFLHLKQSKNALFFLCTLQDVSNLFISTNDDNISARFINLAGLNSKDPTSFLPHNSYAITTCIFDYSCTNSLQVLQAFSSLRYFNTTYSWLFLADNNSRTDVNHILGKLMSVQMNSDITVAEPVPESNGTSFELVDIYAKGRHLCRDVYRTVYGRWSYEGGLEMVANYRRYYVRGNFNGLQVRGTTVIDQDNVTSQDVDRILSVPGTEQGIVSFVKYHYALLVMLRDYHNFGVKYRVTRGWAGRLKSGYRLGLLGILARNEADIAATAIFQRINRHAEFDIIHQSWEFSAGFIYRITPQLSGATGGGNFFTPFEDSVWIASLITLTAILVILKFSVFIIFKSTSNEPNTSLISYLVDIVGTVSQQGIAGRVSARMPIRIILFSLLTLNLVLFNYYTSSVVGGLLSSPGKGPQTIREIIDSPLKLAFRDIGYHKILFRETQVPIIRELYEKKTTGLFNDLRLMSFVVPKRSMYTEMFRITMMRLQEIGLIKRTLKIHRIEKPICQSGGRVLPVEVSGVSTAFAVLGVGMFLSTMIMLLEKLHWNYMMKRQYRNFLN